MNISIGNGQTEILIKISVFYLIYIVLMGIAILAPIFWIFMLVDVDKRNFKKDKDKIPWILVIVLQG